MAEGLNYIACTDNLLSVHAIKFESFGHNIGSKFGICKGFKGHTYWWV